MKITFPDKKDHDKLIFMMSIHIHVKVIFILKWSSLLHAEVLDMSAAGVLEYNEFIRSHGII